MTGLVFDIKRFALHDGPGIRTTAFLKGCSLRCRWCQNPEGISTQRVLWYHKARCIRCGACIKACPTGALSSHPDSSRFIHIHRPTCDLRGACVTACPSTALEFDCKEYTSEDLVRILLRDRVFYNTSGGGITLSGGEPFVQAAFSEEVLGLCRKENLHTAIETTMNVDPSVLARFVPLVDLFLADIKLWDAAEHLANTGVDNRRILSSVRWLAEQRSRMIVRVPLIPGATATPQNIRAIAAFVHDLPGDVPLELINFNPLASGKYYALDLPYDFASYSAPLEQDVVDSLADIARNEGVKVI